MSNISYPFANWQKSGTTSEAVNISQYQLVGFATPSGFTSTSITLLASPTVDGTYLPVKAATGGSAITFTVTTSSWYSFTADLIAQLQSLKHLKFVGGSSEAAGTQLMLAIVPRLIS